MSDIRMQASQIVAGLFDTNVEEISDSTGFISDLGADSLDVIELILSFEEHFGIEIHDSAAEAMQTFGDAVALIEKISGRSTMEAAQ